jgi:hypothetical protein
VLDGAMVWLLDGEWLGPGNFCFNYFELSFLKSWFEELEENGKTCQDTIVFSLQWGEWIRG